MTFEIRHDGTTYTVHTEVGDGLTRVLFEETPRDTEPQAQPQQGQAREE